MARRRRRFWPYLRMGLLALALLAAGYTLYLDHRVRHEFEGRRFALPARIYARPLELHVGLKVPEDDVVRELRELGYRPVAREDRSGWYVRNGTQLDIAVRPFTFGDGPQPARELRVGFEAGTVTSLTDAKGADLALARLEPRHDLRDTSRLVVLVVGEEPRPDRVPVEQDTRHARVLGRHHVDFFQPLERAQSDVPQVTNRGGNYI